MSSSITQLISRYLFYETLGKDAGFTEFLLAEGEGVCYKPCDIMKSVLINSAFAVMLLSGPVCPAQTAAAGAEEVISAEATQAVAVANAGVERLAELLVQVEDAASAAALLPQIAETLESVRALEAGSFAEDDEEMMAAGFANDWYLLVEDEVARLVEDDFYGNAQLRQLLDAGDSADEAFEKPVSHPAASTEAPVQEAATESLLPR